MIAVVQRVSEASVTINGIVKASIGAGFLVLLGIAIDDTKEDIDWLSKKILGLRVFSDQDDKMNLSLENIDGEILIISQFTLLANTKKGNRPSFIEAAPPAIAIPHYESMIECLNAGLNKEVKTGEFGADMKVALLNDGPVTIVIDSKNKK